MRARGESGARPRRPLSVELRLPTISGRSQRPDASPPRPVPTAPGGGVGEKCGGAISQQVCAARFLVMEVRNFSAAQNPLSASVSSYHTRGQSIEIATTAIG